MTRADNLRRDDLLTAITASPGIKKRELMELFGITRSAAEMHLARLADAKQVHSIDIAGAGGVRAWYPGPAPTAPRGVVASVFDLGRFAEVVR